MKHLSRWFRGALVAGLLAGGNALLDSVVTNLPPLLAGTKYAFLGGLALMIVNSLRDKIFYK